MTHGFSRAALWLCCAAVSGVAYADFTPNAYSLSVTGQQWTFNPEGGAATFDSNQSVITSEAGGATTAELNMCFSASLCAGKELFGGFSDLTTGSLGGFAQSVDGNSQAVMHASLSDNLDFTGSGTATITLHLQALIGGSMSSYGGGVQANNYTYDPNTNIGISVGPTIAAGASIQQGFGSQLGVDATSIDKDVSIVLAVDAAHPLFSLLESIQVVADGTGSVDATHTASLSIQLSPGLTLDQSNGFLTKSGDPAFLNPTATPEPTSIAIFLALGVFAADLLRKRLNRPPV
jgi:hypothetical protein